MTDLIAVLSTGKGTWAQVRDLMNGEDWNNVFLLTNEFGKEKFTSLTKKTEVMVCNFDAEPDEIAKEIHDKLKGKVKSEIGVNFVSGAGKEHMALMSALIKLGIGFRLIVLTPEGIKEL